MMLARSIFAISILGICLLSCKSNPPGPDGTGGFGLTILDASCSEAWLRIALDSSIRPRAITLMRGTTTLLTTSLQAAETLIVDQGLLPNHRYTYTLSRPTGFGSNDSRSAAVTTLDTTSSDFTWQIDTLGVTSSSLYDVTIINDTLAYAMGEMYLRDSTGQLDPILYNLAVWNGATWSIHRVAYNYQGQQFFNPIQSVFAFNRNDIWLCGNGVIRWNGAQFVEVPIPTSVWGPYRMNKMWGSSSYDLYAVGDGGSIARYANGWWQRIEGGTDLQFLDIYGASDSKTGEQQILAVCTRNYPLGQAVFSIQNNIANQISSYPIQWELWSVWFVPNRRYYVVGSGIYEKGSLTDTLWENGPLDITRYGTTRVRANGLNDVFVVGAFGECLHYNGKSWKSFHSVTGLAYGGYSSVAARQGMIMAVGAVDGHAVATIGRRY